MFSGNGNSKFLRRQIPQPHGKLQLLSLHAAIDVHQALSALGTKLRREGDQLIDRRIRDQIALDFPFHASGGLGAGPGNNPQRDGKGLFQGQNSVEMDEAVNFGGIAGMLNDLAQGPAQAAVIQIKIPSHGGRGLSASANP